MLPVHTPPPDPPATRISSRFTICSETLTPAEIISSMPWRVTESVERGTSIDDPKSPIATHPFSIVTFDLDIPSFSCINAYLRHSGAVLEKMRTPFRKQLPDCTFGLWIRHTFTEETAFNLSPELMRTFARLRIECVFQLCSSAAQ